jgi:hypothetical protein
MSRAMGPTPGRAAVVVWNEERGTTSLSLAVALLQCRDLAWQVVQRAEGETQPT